MSNILDYNPNANTNFNNAGANTGNGAGNMMFGDLTHPVNQSGQGRNQNGQPRRQSKIWMNVGRQIGDDFISLPLGQGIDTMDPSEVRGQNVEFVKKRTAQNDLLKALQQLGFSLEPGETKILNLQVQIRRVNEQLDVSGADNEFTIDPATLLAAE